MICKKIVTKTKPEKSDHLEFRQLGYLLRELVKTPITACFINVWRLAQIATIINQRQTQHQLINILRINMADLKHIQNYDNLKNYH